MHVVQCVEYQQQMQAGVVLLDTDVMPILIIIALDSSTTLHFSISCSTIICSPTILFSFKREASSETYGPWVYFPSYQFPIYYFAIFYFQFYKPKHPKIFYLLFSLFIYLLQISLLQVTVQGLTTPLSCWVQVFDCLCMCIDWRLHASPTGLITWFLTEGNPYLYFAASPFLLQGKNQRMLKKQQVTGILLGRISFKNSLIARESYQ